LAAAISLFLAYLSGIETSRHGADISSLAKFLAYLSGIETGVIVV